MLFSIISFKINYWRFMFVSEIKINAQQIISEEELKTYKANAPLVNLEKSPSSRAAFRKFRALSNMEIANRPEIGQNEILLHPDSGYEKIFQEIYKNIFESSSGGHNEGFEAALELTEDLLSSQFDYSGENWIYKAKVYSLRMELQHILGIEQSMDDYLALTDLVLANIDSFTWENIHDGWKRFGDEEGLHDSIMRACMLPHYDVHFHGYFAEESKSFLLFNRALALFARGDEEKGIAELKASASQGNRTALLAGLLLRVKTGEAFTREDNPSWHEPYQDHTAQMWFWQGLYHPILENIWGAWPSDQLGADDMYYGWRGAAQYMLGDYTAAISEYEKAIASYKEFGGYPDPIAFDHEISLAIVYYMSGDISTALERLKLLQQQQLDGRSACGEELWDWPKWQFTAKLLEQFLKVQAGQSLLNPS
jgi:tetratricopeptide (TPR) repeat protein